MVDFSNFNHLNPSGDKPVNYELDIPGMEDPIVLEVLPALAVNKPLLNEQAKMHAKLQRKMGRKQELSVKDLEEMRSVIRKQYAQYVVKGWKNVLDASGEPVPFSVDNCHQFLMILPDEMFDEIADFCRDPENFLESEDAEDLGKL
jgi:hypothetical protein